jgi:hypothetical protein
VAMGYSVRFGVLCKMGSLSDSLTRGLHGRYGWAGGHCSNSDRKAEAARDILKTRTREAVARGEIDSLSRVRQVTTLGNGVTESERQVALLLQQELT